MSHTHGSVMLLSHTYARCMQCVLQCVCCSLRFAVCVLQSVLQCVLQYVAESRICMQGKYPRNWERTLLDAFKNLPCSHCNTHSNTLQHTLQQGTTQGIGALFQPAQTIRAIQSSLHIAARNAQVHDLRVAVCVAVCVATCVATCVICCSTHCSTLAIHNASNRLSALPPEMLM